LARAVRNASCGLGSATLRPETASEARLERHLKRESERIVVRRKERATRSMG
jgi:hypothetical protein